ncbi:MAG: SDR family oxidoreductase [Spirochaetales bacterium]|nr:SDR family oxidoreductase [Leptospiraceae bacterium]MCP5482022.1 SDR family oxidoreductase [Spirochaetales bacterium]MCP5486503.1 SDR family oxidoreductase [Spirochaetales bacterium]
MDLNLTGKRALVAAASRGLGFGIARALAREGAHVSLCSRDFQKARTAAEHIESETGAPCFAYAADMSRPEDIEAWVQASLSELGGTDIVVANAGGPPAGDFDAFNDDAWQRAFELTLMSVVRLVRACLPALKNSQSPAILAVTSISVRQPIDHLLLSNVFRSGVVALLKTLSFELAPFGIRVNNLAPGRIDTDRIRELDESLASRENTSADEIRRRHAESMPLGRYGTPEEFSRMAAFLVSPAASYITGQTILVDGGFSRV